MMPLASIDRSPRGYGEEDREEDVEKRIAKRISRSFFKRTRISTGRHENMEKRMEERISRLLNLKPYQEDVVRITRGYREAFSTLNLERKHCLFVKA